MSARTDTASPAMAQWFALKAEHPDALLFFRMGDFFEMFFDDAAAAAAALDIALTHRGEHAGAPIPMCGVPVAHAESYLARLIRRGFRVAIAEQMEPAAARTGKAPLRRAIVRLVTPGTLTEDSLLDATRPNLLLALTRHPDSIGAAWLDVSTGLFETADTTPALLPALLGRLDPAEILAPDTLPLADHAPRRAPTPAQPAPAAARRLVAEAFGAASLDAFGTFTDAEATAAALALDYIRLTQAGQLPRLSRPTPTGQSHQLEMDAATRASLELLRARDGTTALTLLASITRTLTTPGARQLAGWTAAPLTEPAAIAARQDGWTFLIANPAHLASLRAALRGTPDIARALSRLSLNRAAPRDLATIRAGLHAAAAAAAALPAPCPHILADARAALTPAPHLQTLLTRALADPPPARLDDGHVIAPGYDAELDAERALCHDSRGVIATRQLDYAQRFGVAALKIRHHAQLGYVLEAPAAAVETLRAHPDLTLRQGMANGARFTLPELSELDRRIAEAAARATAREHTILATLTAATLAQADAIAAAAAALATLDVLQSHARLAEGGDWCRPEITEDDAFHVTAGRHPVVQSALANAQSAPPHTRQTAPAHTRRTAPADTRQTTPAHTPHPDTPATTAFIPNDADLSPDRRLLLLTGPNMAGKSTYLRQNALIAILAQSGAPAPATAARIGIIDRLFSRVGAADELARGRSTFMVEMIETAAILHQAGPRSLVIVDEIGRGTATLDGLAIAWAVLEALHSQIRCRTIFATHFHELARLTETLPRLRPHMMRVREWRGSVVFLHEVAEGAAGRSWGVHVASLAGIPATTVRRAGVLLAALERGRAPVIADLPLFASLPEEPPPDPLRTRLAGIDPDKLSAREALALLYELKASAEGEA